MAKTYEQEILEIESARISADLSYQREREIVHNKPLFSKKQIESLQKQLPWMFVAGFICGMFFWYIISKL
jgi:hypothetical protein